MRNYLKALPNKVDPNCEKGHYYLVNNYNPGYFGDGSNAYTDTNKDNYVYTIPPSDVRTIGDALIDKGVSCLLRRAVQRYLLKVIENMDLRPPRAAA